MTLAQSDLKELDVEALNRAKGPERAAYLDQACRRDASLLAQVEELLEAHVRAGVLLTSAPETTTGEETNHGVGGTAAAAAEPLVLDHARQDLAPPGLSAEGPGSRIGPYTIIHKLGEGGMGIVFLAEQERAVRRKVALKVIKPGMDTEQVVASFEAERQALALMDHDFGVAKAVDRRLTERTLFTQFGALVGTPEYMSAEQAGDAGAGIDTRSDVYALGVLLYELLTGTTPLGPVRLMEAGVSEVLRRVREEEPPKPSTRLSGSGDALASIAACRDTDPARITRLVQGELDWITMKALQKERRPRYATALELGRDVQRYLDDEPVAASPPSLFYRAGKLARKHRAAFVIAAGAILFLAGAALVSSWLMLRARPDVRPAAAPAIQPRWVLKDHTDVAWCVAFAPDGKSLVTCSGNRDATAGELCGYRLDTGQPVSAYRALEPHGIRWVAFAPDGKSLATAEYDGTIRIRDAATGSVLTQWPAHPGGVQCVEFTRDGRTLVTCGKDGRAKVWDIATREIKATMVDSAEHMYSLDLSHDEKTLLTGTSGATAVSRDVETGARKQEFRENKGPVEVVRDSLNGTMFAVAGWDGVVNLYGATTGSRVRILHGSGGGILAAAFTPDSRSLVVGTELGEVQVWNVATGDALNTIVAHDGNIRAVAFSSDGKLMATAGHDWTIKIWDAP